MASLPHSAYANNPENFRGGPLGIDLLANLRARLGKLPGGGGGGGEPASPIPGPLQFNAPFNPDVDLSGVTPGVGAPAGYQYPSLTSGGATPPWMAQFNQIMGGRGGPMPPSPQPPSGGMGGQGMGMGGRGPGSPSGHVPGAQRFTFNDGPRSRPMAPFSPTNTGGA